MNKKLEFGYTVLYYQNSSQERVNLAIVFVCKEEWLSFIRFYNTSNWKRIKLFDASLNIPVLQAFLQDMKRAFESAGTELKFDEIFRAYEKEKFLSSINFGPLKETYAFTKEEIFEKMEEIKKEFLRI